MFERLKFRFRAFKISFMLANEHGIVLTPDNPLFEPVLKFIVGMLKVSDWPDERIVKYIANMIETKFGPTEK